MTPIPTPSSGSTRAPTIISPSPSALPCCLRASAPSFASTRPARTRSSRSARTRFGQARSCCSIPRQQGPLDREGELDPALPLPRRPAAGITGDAVAGGLGLQLGSHHAHARDAHLSITAKDREGCRRSGHPGHRSGRLQTGALIAAVITIEDYIAFLARVPILRRLGADALRILGVNAVGSAAVAVSINAAMK